MKTTLKILILEDSPTDAELILRLLKKEKMHCEFSIAMDKENFLKALEDFCPDVILSDNSLPQFNSMEALKIARLHLQNIPFILVTGNVSDEFAAGIIKSGADDYVIKDRLSRLPAAIDTALKQRRIEKEKEDALKILIQSEEQYRDLVDNISDLICTHDLDGKVLSVNSAAEKLTGFKFDLRQNINIKDLLASDVKNGFNDYISGIKKNGFANGMMDVKTRSGDIRIWEYNNSLKITGVSTPIIRGYARDITESKKAEEALKKSETKYRNVVENIHEALIIENRDGCLVYANTEFYRMFGYSPDKDEILSLRDYTTAESYDEVLERHNNRLNGMKVHEEFEYKGLRKDGTEIWIEARVSTIIENDKIVGTQSLERDITERKKAERNLKLLEQKILNQKVQEQKKITRAMLKAQEEQRNHIGQELHDNINQILAGTKMYLSLAGSKNEAIKEVMKYPIELIDSSIEEIRLLCRDLVTPLKDINLEESIQDLLRNFNQSTMTKTGFTYSISNKFHSDDLKLNIYRIIQEQLNNILKYAGAKNVNISIKAKGKAISIIVTDDGNGFDVEKKRKGIGISNMINRIKSYNGKVAIKSSPGNGCQITVTIPY